MRGLSEFQLLSRTPHNSADKISVKRRPTAPEGVAYQLADIVRDSPVQVRPVVVMQEDSIDSLQQQVRTFWVEYREFLVFLWIGGVPPHMSEL